MSEPGKYTDKLVLIFVVALLALVVTLSLSNSGGAKTFLLLEQTPSTFNGHADECLKVAPTEDATYFNDCSVVPGPQAPFLVVVFATHAAADTDYPTPTGGQWTLGTGLTTVPTGWFRNPPTVPTGQVLIASQTDQIDPSNHAIGDVIHLATHWGAPQGAGDPATWATSGNTDLIPSDKLAPAVKVIDGMAWGNGTVSVAVADWRTRFRYLQFVVDENAAVQLSLSASVSTALLADNITLDIPLQQNDALRLQPNGLTDTIVVSAQGFTATAADSIDVWGIP